MFCDSIVLAEVMQRSGKRINIGEILVYGLEDTKQSLPWRIPQ